MVFLSMVFLLLASLGFYAWDEPVFVLIIALSIAANRILPLSIAVNRALALARHKERRRWFVAAIGFDAAVSTTDCWRCRHLSLSAWFRDYVCIPLGGNRATVAACAWAKPEGWL